MPGKVSSRKLFGSEKFALFIVEQAQDSVGNRKMRATQGEVAVRNLVGHVREGLQVLHADLYSFQFHRQFRFPSCRAKLLGYGGSRFIQHIDPVSDVPTFAEFIAMEVLRERSFAPAAKPMSHHDDFFHFQELHGEFDRCRYTVTARCRLERRNEGSDVADHENLSRSYIQDLRRIDAAIRARNHHYLR